MTKEDKAKVLKVRLRKLKTRPNATDAPGVIKKVSRQLRNLERDS
jgi:hypothetical protein